MMTVYTARKQTIYTVCLGYYVESKMWDQKFYNLDIHTNYMYFHDPIRSELSGKYDNDQYYGLKKI